MNQTPHHRPTGRVGLALAALAVLAATAVAITAASASRTASSLVVDIATPPSSLDPAQVCSLQDQDLIAPLYVTLLQNGTSNGIEDQSKLLPDLATSWSITNGGTVYTFNLTPKAKFPDGTPMDSAAVKYTFQRDILSGACGAYFATAGQGAALIKSIATPSATKIVITLSRPEELFIHSLAIPNMGIVEPKVVQAHGGQQKGVPNQWMADNAAGGGPYTLQSYQPGHQLVYTANPTYFGPTPKTSQITVNFITSDPTLLLQARTGAADVTLGLSDQSVSSLKGNSSVQIVATPQFAWQLISLPNQMAPFNNLKLREALTYAVPYQEIVQKVAFGYGVPYYGVFPPHTSAYNATIDAPRPYDLNKAKQLIAASGVKTPISLDLLILDGATDQAQIATIIQGEWKQLGVNVTVKNLAAAQYENSISAPHKTYSVIRFDGPSVEDPAWLLDYDMRAASVFNTSNMSIPAAEALLNKAEASTSESYRQQVWQEISKMWVADSPRIPVYQNIYTVVLKKGLTGYTYYKELFNMWDWGKTG
jgi:peptide/nickel transport system substrate-binding protein